MNFAIVFRTLARIMFIVAILLAIPMIVSFYFQENIFYVYLIPIIILFALSAAMSILPSKKTMMYAKEGYVIVALSWILLSAFGCLPFVISGAIPSFVDAWFETVSGFTTTGSSILTNIEALPKSLLFWRSFTHWIGGMGVLVFVLAVLPSMQGTEMHLMRAEVPGPKVSKLASKMRFSARLLYGIYLGLTVLEMIALKIAGQPFFDSAVNAFATAGTGGFSVLNTSIGGYNSPAVEYIISVFMLLFGVNFNLFYFILIRKFSQTFKNEELKTYLLIVLSAITLIVINIYPMYDNFEHAFRAAVFQVSSIITTTGFGTADFNTWPVFSQTILVFLMFIGACAGSTGGGIKISRIIILVKQAIKEVKRTLNNRYVTVVKMDKKAISPSVLSGVSLFFIVYICILSCSILLLSLDGFDLTTTTTAVIACINNIGPGLGEVGPVGNYAAFSDFGKILLSFNMLAGRLEIFPILVLFYPRTWSRG